MSLIEKENINKLSDDELFAALKKVGLNVGPITGTTRSLYEKRLRNYLEANDNNVTLAAAEKTVVNTKDMTITEPSKKDFPIETNKIIKSTVSIPSSVSSVSSILIEKNPIISEKIITDTTNILTKTNLSKPQITEEISIKEKSNLVSKSSNPTYENPISNFYTTQENKNNIRAKSTESPVRTINSNPTQSLTQSTNLMTTSLSRETGYNSLNQASVSNVSSIVVQNVNIPTKNGNIGVNLINSNQANIPNRLPSPLKDKFAERLNNYGLIKTDLNNSTATASVNSNFSCTKMTTPSNLRTRNVNFQESSLINEPKLNYTKVVDEPRSKPELTKTQPVLQTDSSSLLNDNTLSTNSSQPPMNIKYLMMVMVLTIIIYFTIIHFQSNPENPVEL